MSVVNNGSIALNIFNSISPMSANLSGLLISIVDNQRFFTEQFTGDTIGNAIAERYQSPITDLATANVLKLMATQDGGVSEIFIGEMKVFNANLLASAKEFETNGMIKLRLLSKGAKSFKARG